MYGGLRSRFLSEFPVPGLPGAPSLDFDTWGSTNSTQLLHVVRNLEIAIRNISSRIALAISVFKLAQILSMDKMYLQYMPVVSG
jgi:hypothetical protein